MRNWDRQYRMVAGVPGEEGFIVGEPVEGRALHCNFSLEKSDASAANTGKIVLTNLNDEHKGILSKKGCTVEFRAGYGSVVGPIFSGGVSKITDTKSGADTDTSIEVVDGIVEYDQLCSMSINGIVGCDVILQSVADEMGVASVLITEEARTKLQDANYDNGYAYVGKAKSALASVTRKAGVSYTMQNGVLQVYVDGEAVTNEAYVLNSQTGLVSTPKRVYLTKQDKGGYSVSESSSASSSTESSKKSAKTKKQAIPGYEIKYLINAAIGINDLVMIESKSVNGVYRVYKQKFEGDNYGDQWICTADVVEVQ